MQIDIGSVYPGKVTGITNFGAFVELQNGQTGLVHISEVALSFVKEIKDILTVGQEVKVKVLESGKNGKLSLSIKAVELQENQQKRKINQEYDKRSRDYRTDARRLPRQVKQDVSPEDLKTARFEDMISKFKKCSDEKMSSLKKNDRSKQRKSNYNK